MTFGHSADPLLVLPPVFSFFFFFFNDTATTEIYTLSLHDALPISYRRARMVALFMCAIPVSGILGGPLSGGIMDLMQGVAGGSGEHTSELQSPCNLGCRLLPEKKKKTLTGSTAHAHAAKRTRAVG